MDYPGAAQTFLTGINNAGDIVGYFQSATGGEDHAFLKHGSKWTELVPPKGIDPDASAISNSGEVLGHYPTNDGIFTYVYKDGQYTTLRSKPGAAFTAGFAINKYQSVVGYFEKTETTTPPIPTRMESFTPIPIRLPRARYSGLSIPALTTLATAWDTPTWLPGGHRDL